jgi:hypothetical protein
VFIFLLSTGHNRPHQAQPVPKQPQAVSKQAQAVSKQAQAVSKQPQAVSKVLVSGVEYGFLPDSHRLSLSFRHYIRSGRPAGTGYP